MKSKRIFSFVLAMVLAFTFLLSGISVMAAESHTGTVISGIKDKMDDSEEWVYGDAGISSTPESANDGQSVGTTTDMLYQLSLDTALTVNSTYNAKDITMQPGSDETKMNFCWYSDATTTAAKVQIALKSDMAGSEFPESSAVTFTGTVASASASNNCNEVMAAGLMPSTEYVYRVGDGMLYSSVYHFKTQNSTSYNALLFGDPQIGASGNDNNDTISWQNTVETALSRFGDTSFILSPGDQVNTATFEVQYDGFFSPEELRSIPVAPILGNHDVASLYQYHFNSPNESTAYGTTTGGGDYWFTYGNTLYMVLNSNNTSTTSHDLFMRDAIASAGSGIKWKVVMFHHSIYSSADHSTDNDIIDRRSSLPSVFDKYDIDAVLMGHDHCYTRSYIMEGGVPQSTGSETEANNPAGTLYITVDSASGSKYYNFQSVDTGYKAFRWQGYEPSYSNVVVTDHSFTVTTYEADDNSVIDTYTIKKDQNAPTGLAGIAPTSAANNDGQITGTTTEMEYKLSADTTWTACSGNTVNGLAAGTYDVRYADLSGSPSTPAVVVIDAFVLDDTIHLLADEQLAPGIHYTEEDHLNYEGTKRRTRINRMEVVPDGKLQIISSKAQDYVNALESIEKQANREIAKGYSVVAAVNADTFDMYTTGGGLPTGLQIQNGAIVLSQPNDFYNANHNPCFFVQEDGSFDIGPLLVRGSITVGDSFTQDVNLINRTNFLNRFAGVARSYENYRVYTSSVNRDRTMRLNAADDSQVPNAQMPVDRAYVLVQIAGFDGMIHPNVTYTGTVISRYTEEGFPIPDDCIVLAGFNDAAPSVAARSVGDTVTYKCHLYTGEFNGGYDSETGQAAGSVTAVGAATELTDVITAVSSFHNIAEDGNLLISPTNSYDGKNARTLLGITADGRLQVVTINESGDLMGNNLTDGSTFQEMADYMVNILGCPDVINLDSGGSAEMAVRRAGSEEITQVSYPSDGGSRSVTNALLFVNGAARTSNLGNVIIDGSSHIYTGSHTAYSFRLTDTNNNPFAKGDMKASWSASKGTIDENGNYTAPAEACEDTITATVNGVTGTIKVTAVDDAGIETITMTPDGSLALDKGDTKQFKFNAYTADKQSVVIDNSAAKWSVTGDGGVELGTMDDGLLTVTASKGTGSVSVTLLGRTFTADLIIGIREQVIENFETTPVEGVYVGRISSNSSNDYGGVSKKVIYNTDNAKVGSSCLQINFDASFSRNINIYFRFHQNNDVAGNGVWNESARADMEAKYIAAAKPKRIGLWVYGDGSGSTLSAGVRTSYAGVVDGSQTGVNKPNLSLGTIDWTGWKWVETAIPSSFEMPIIFRYLWVTCKNQGSGASSMLRFDDLKYIYTSDGADLKGPEFFDTTPEEGSLYQNTLNFSTTIADAKSDVNTDTIQVTINDSSVKDYTYDTETGVLSFSRTGMEDGNYTVKVSVKDTQGNDASPLEVTYHVDTAPDTEAPVIDQVTPRSGTVFPIQVSRPRINFCLRDAKGTVDADSVKVTLNDTPLSVYLDSLTGYGYAQPDFDLQPGTATLKIDASDSKGNAMNTWTDSFEISPVAQPSDPDNYKITIIPATQGNSFSSSIFGRAAADESEIVIHLGDIVASKNQSDYDAAVNYIKNQVNKPVFVAAGSNEGLNMDLYYKTFNSPTYYFDYGDTRIIVLNSALGQSVSNSDSTQYHWLAEILAENALPNVLVVNNAVTRDGFGSGHSMPAEEAEKFEGIMTAYKTGHPGSTVKVFFGNMHNLQTWTAGDVDYITGGNASGKNYVTHSQGDLLGTGVWSVKNGAANYSFKPLLTKVYIKNMALYGDTITAASGSTLQMDLYGDFREYPANYLTQISGNSLVDIKWSTSDTNVATVDDKGVVTLRDSIGTASVTAECGGKSGKIQIKSVDPDQIDVTKISISLPPSAYVGEKILPTVYGVDPYGAVFALNVKSVSMICEDDRMTVDSDGYLYAAGSGTATVTASYKGKTASTQIELTAKPHSNSSSGGSGGDSSSYTNQKYITSGNSSVNIDLTGNSTVLSSSQMASILASNAKMPVVLSGKNYSITFAAGSMRETGGKADYDFGVSFNTGTNYSRMKGLAGNGLALVVKYNYSGALPAEAEIKIRIGTEYAGQTLYYYRYNEGFDQLEYMQSVVVDDSGFATVTQNHCSDYAFTTDIPVTRVSDRIVKTSIPLDRSGTMVPYRSVNGEDRIVAFSAVSNGNLYFMGNSSDTYRFQDNAKSYTDMESHWAKEAVVFVAVRELLQGTGAGVFSPDVSMTRGMAVTVLGRLCGADISGFKTARFDDVKTGSYYVSYVEWAAENGIVNGTGDGKFSPDKTVTREELAVMLYHCASYTGLDAANAAENTVSLIPDEAKISVWAKEASAWAVNTGIIVGDSNGAFTPSANATRAQTAVMIQRLIQRAVLKTQ